ncbi:MAG TPA: HAMP domain-containing histidine kinase [Candidatus Intestinimonas stercorigallinarum]|nr:HAMP domain-containing histidine kinase [Candidatus Intestinimonas stercorigallinarum]
MQLKFALTYLIIIAAVLILLNTYPVLVSQDLVFRSKTSLLQSQASVIADTIARTESLTSESVRDYMEQLGYIGQFRVLVTDEFGLILYDSDELRFTEGRYAMLGEVSAALRGYNAAISSYQDGAFHSRAAVPVIYRDMTIGCVYLYERDTDQAQLLTDIQRNLTSISLVICVVVLIMSGFFSRVLTRRVGELLRAIRIVREGEYGHRVDIRGRDELSQLAGEFNQLTGRLQTTEEVRRRFVSDASHELKTPLASIRLLTDSILQTDGMDPATVRDFVSDIGEEADRLTRISEKLLTLTRMDSAVAVETAPVEVAPVVEKVVHMLSPLAKESAVTVETCLEADCVVQATQDDLYQIAFNLVENAVKYNVPGGRVMVGLRAMGDLVLLTVEDTGVGIPEEDLPKVFDRFYRVDKARSRAAGGTGLGLSIVKDTARQHGGAVTVRRREEGGTCFQVAFPRWTEEGGAPL